MSKNTNKTQATTLSVADYISSIEDLQKRDDCKKLIELMSEVSGEQPVMWGASIVGFGSYNYKYESGREGDSFIIGFAARKQSLSIYLSRGLQSNPDLLAKLGSYTKSDGSCLYVKKLSNIDLTVLKELLKRGYIATQTYWSTITPQAK
jgi:hypothetical protein